MQQRPCDGRALQQPAQQIVTWSDRLPALFPPGSLAGATYALPNIWTDTASFAVAVSAMQTAAQRLQAASRTGDRAASANAYRAAANACGSCHREFRKR